MVRKVFSRIWRTFIIILNTVWNLLSTVLAFATLFESSEYTRQANIQAWGCGMVIIIAINILNHVGRKNFENY